MPHKDWNTKHQETLSLQDRVADRITSFAGSMPFIYIHALWFIAWIVFRVEAFPFGLLTMLVSLEAIFLSTLVMISQNRQASRDKVQAEHNYVHQESELALNTKLTQEVKELTQIIHNKLGSKKVKINVK